MNPGLRAANRIRTHRSQLRKRVKHGEFAIADLLTLREPWLDEAATGAVLTWIRGISTTRAQEILDTVGIPWARPLRRLSDLDRACITSVIAERFPQVVA